MKGTGYNTLVITYKDKFIGLITAKELARVYISLSGKLVLVQTLINKLEEFLYPIL